MNVEIRLARVDRRNARGQSTPNTRRATSASRPMIGRRRIQRPGHTKKIIGMPASAHARAGVSRHRPTTSTSLAAAFRITAAHLLWSAEHRR